ncbi:hypothetical protein DPEC_G00328190 [Dallia pectoralis]|uniref:Uncharacterized protein n=1 Tax=Dallia pectoralis TaxID=75939 RepID=A0ACC2F8D5_DALPE|nr:hypothetical protein DPEC_G00328190 [Dallia pectoralis]
MLCRPQTALDRLAVNGVGFSSSVDNIALVQAGSGLYDTCTASGAVLPFLSDLAPDKSVPLGQVVWRRLPRCSTLLMCTAVLQESGRKGGQLWGRHQ